MISAEELAPHYSAFRVSERLLLTGHSHQAWPDVGREGVLEAWDDAALHADEKWGRAFEKADRVRDGFRLWLEAPDAELALDQNTFGLVLRFLSTGPAAPPAGDDERRVPHAQAADGAARGGGAAGRRRRGRAPCRHARGAAGGGDGRAHGGGARLSGAVRGLADRPGARRAGAACETRGAELLVDVYHALGVMSFPSTASARPGSSAAATSTSSSARATAFSGVPPHGDELRPRFTGWYAEFAELAAEKTPGAVEYPRGGMRFAGATYDPTSHYRAARVFDFFEQQGLTPSALRENYLRQTTLLADALGVEGRVRTTAGSSRSRSRTPRRSAAASPPTA